MSSHRNRRNSQRIARLPVPSAKLILVEDDPALAELLEFRFANEGYQVRVTANGDEALLMASEDVPDLIILDWMIEGTSGIEVCRRLRRDKDTAHVPIIMLTAKGEEIDRVVGFEVGADDYVVKSSFSVREMVLRVRALLRRRGTIATKETGTRIELGRLSVDDSAHRVWVDGDGPR